MSFVVAAPEVVVAAASDLAGIGSAIGAANAAAAVPTMGCWPRAPMRCRRLLRICSARTPRPIRH
ncbi:PE-PGRS family protein [Mycobacterium tuberculosis]|nr:PE-PGRS family protein [Mycobacterium tuberculosis]